MAIDWATIGGGTASVASVAMLIWNGFLRQKLKLQTSKADEATAKQTTAQAVAGETVYTLVTEQLKRVQDELTVVRAELAKQAAQLRDKDTEIHKLRMHIVDLEHCIAQAGIPAPTMRD